MLCAYVFIYYCANRLLRCASNHLFEDDDQSQYMTYIYLRTSKIKSSRIKNERVNTMIKKSQRGCQAKSTVNQKSKVNQSQSRVNTSQTQDQSKIDHYVESQDQSRRAQVSRVKDRSRKSTPYKLDQDKNKSRSEAYGWTYTVDCKGRKTPRQTLMAYLSATVKSARVANGRPPGAEVLPLIVQAVTSKKDKVTRVVSHRRTSTPRVMKLLSSLKVSKWRDVSHGRPSEERDHPSAADWSCFQTHFK